MNTLVKQTRPKRIFYALNINMAYSFDSLYKIAKEQLGAELEVGDVIVVDNKNGDKRKMLQMTKSGYMIFYARLHRKEKFTRLAQHNGQLKAITGSIF